VGLWAAAAKSPARMLGGRLLWHEFNCRHDHSGSVDTNSSSCSCPSASARLDALINAPATVVAAAYPVILRRLPSFRANGGNLHIASTYIATGAFAEAASIAPCAGGRWYRSASNTFMLYAGASVPVQADAASECAKVAGGAHRSCSTSARSLLENGMYGFGRLYSAKTMRACVINRRRATTHSRVLSRTGPAAGTHSGHSNRTRGLQTSWNSDSTIVSSTVRSRDSSVRPLSDRTSKNTRRASCSVSTLLSLQSSASLIIAMKLHRMRVSFRQVYARQVPAQTWDSP
jgi:hypothetical protein